MRDRTDWYLIQGTPGFFRCPKKLHNALQGIETELCGDPRRGRVRNAVRL
ncbi:hypothetical protein [Bradyrhizobium sp.]